MASGYFVIIKDLMGWRFGYAKAWNGVTFRMDNGQDLAHNVFLATQSNMTAMVTGATPSSVKDQMYWPMKAEKAVDFLEEHGYAVDDSLRIYPKLGEPFVSIKAGNIGPIVMVHVKSCKERSKEPEREPIVLIHHEYTDESGAPQGGLCQIYDTNKLVPLPCEEEMAGKFCYVGKQICLKFQDYYLVPKGSNTLAMHKFLDATEGPEELDELFKSGRFIDRDGVVRRSGRSTLTMQAVSIDDFLK